MTNTHLKISAVVAAMALIVPVGAVAKRPDGKAKKRNGQSVKLVSANVKGVVESNDGTTMTVTVDKVSGHLKGCKGQTLSFDVSDPALKVFSADNTPDGEMTIADVLAGHAVKVRTKVTRTKGRKTACSVVAEDLLTAKAVHNRTTPKVDEAEESVEV